MRRVASPDAQSIPLFQQLTRAAVLLYVKYPLSLRNVEDLLAERRIDVCHQTAYQWLQKFTSAHASFHNHFNHERHLIDRHTYKTRRSAAMAEWRNLAS